MRTIRLSKGDKYKGNLILVNQSWPLQNEEMPPCVPILDAFPQVLLHVKASACLRQILKNIDGLSSIVPVSGYRPLVEQEEIYRDSLAENGAEFTVKFVAKPGCSEHQSGLAIDLGQKADDIDFLCPDFPDKGICGDFRRLASQYGFIQRYTKEKEEITQIACEPWHFRYVGYPHSEIMETLGFCLEEYIEYIKNFSMDGDILKVQCGRRQIQIAYVPETQSEIKVADEAIAEISGNNVDGCIVTLWN